MENECKIVWQTFPKVWRKWWEDDFEAAGLEVPPLQSQEIEISRVLFGEGVSGEIQGLLDSLVEFLNPLVLCPWGCTEYYCTMPLSCAMSLGLHRILLHYATGAAMCRK